ncbi:MAG TPA: YqaJ viral recombinase family protein [Pseudomonas sp.]|nr:YqaJ viral recombinase family protein [Pseudomonas sp.]
MNREIIECASEAEWLALRERDVTSTETAALFGCSPYLTEYELWHRKTGQLPVEFEVNQRMVWGNRLESAIAMGIAEDFGLIVEPFKVYVRIPELRMGSSFDFKIIGLREGAPDNIYRELFREHGPGIMEVKNVDGLAFKRGWIADGEDMEAPPHIELQVQHQQEVADLDWTLIAPLVGGNTPRPFHRLRNRDYGGLICDKIATFWHSVDIGKAPDPDYSKDGDTIARLFANDNGETLDMTGNNRLAELVAAYTAAAADEKAAKARKDAAKAEALLLIGNAAKVVGSGFTISAAKTKGSQGKLITEADVGSYVGGRAGYRDFRVNLKSGAPTK